jgi:hypothetical protein
MILLLFVTDGIRLVDQKLVYIELNNIVDSIINSEPYGK